MVLLLASSLAQTSLMSYARLASMITRRWFSTNLLRNLQGRASRPDGRGSRLEVSWDVDTCHY
jgi:hypothetical protein